ncbi:uncharacterized protein LOC105426235 [Pogonomyrmex barbatus]|uniref:Uncharacterized protein LOC105426235 n=1 Tax=Pogonomyrmex barbatus TaxID=144034 RepID=A0A6I9W382_9HYME|nr:uncharacterized protein LOC105426235 [Pogonomyrmex barbatus]
MRCARRNLPRYWRWLRAGLFPYEVSFRLLRLDIIAEFHGRTCVLQVEICPCGHKFRLRFLLQLLEETTQDGCVSLSTAGDTNKSRTGSPKLQKATPQFFTGRGSYFIKGLLIEKT